MRCPGLNDALPRQSALPIEPGREPDALARDRSDVARGGRRVRLRAHELRTAEPEGDRGHHRVRIARAPFGRFDDGHGAHGREHPGDWPLQPMTRACSISAVKVPPRQPGAVERNSSRVPLHTPGPRTTTAANGTGRRATTFEPPERSPPSMSPAGPGERPLSAVGALACPGRPIACVRSRCRAARHSGQRPAMTSAMLACPYHETMAGTATATAAVPGR